ncbi:MAG TPA: endonuclease/exonuclease/phosphatase family protein [Gemmataceae bacterium]|nr:endonuclease/exonuclease/phosphatase family protein [Gemmataceae bacterium]
MMSRKAQIGATGLWVSRVLLASSASVLWSYARYYPPSPTFLGVLLALTFLGGASLFLWRVVRYRTVPARQAATDVTLGLAAMASAFAFLFTVLSNREESLSVTQAATDTTIHLDRLRIVDFNVLHGIPAFDGQEARFQDTLAAFRVLDPDIIVLQEVWDTSTHGNMARRLGEALHLNYVYARANGSRHLLGFEEGSAILSRLPILDARRLLLAPRTPWWECRIALVVTIDVGGRQLTVCGLHCHDQMKM